jgi:hypothetical protein
LAAFQFLKYFTQTLGLPGRMISPSQGLYLHIEQHKHGINGHKTDIHVLCGIRTQDPSVRENEDSYALDRAASVIGNFNPVSLRESQFLDK